MTDTHTQLVRESDRLLLAATTSRSRKARDVVSSVWMLGSFLVALVPLAVVISYVVVKGISVIDAAWFTEDLPAVSTKPGGGMGPAIVGTLLITAGATVLAVPLGVLGAIYLHEYGGRGRLASVIRTRTARTGTSTTTPTPPRSCPSTRSFRRPSPTKSRSST